MIWANNIFQPKLCAIDFSVDSEGLRAQTKFCRGDNLQLQLSIGGRNVALDIEGANNEGEDYHDGDFDKYPYTLMYAVLDKYRQIKLGGLLSLINTESIINESGYVETVYYHLGASRELASLANGMYTVYISKVPKSNNVFNFDTIVADSEVFEIIDTPEKTVLFNFQHYKPLLGCIFSDATNYMFRLSGYLRKNLTEFSANNSEFETYDNRNIRTIGFPTATYTLTIGGVCGIPEETLTKLLLSLQCKDLIINGEYALIASGQDKLEVVDSLMDGNKVVNLKIQKRSNKYVSGSNTQGLFAGGQAPTLSGKYV